MSYIRDVIEVRETNVFTAWFKSLRDVNAKARILTRVRRLSLGNPGDTKSVGHGISELRVDYGPGYRIYFAHRGATLVILLAGGDKGTQRQDIALARELAQRV
jgi:putative addiction module killer protein